MKAIVMQRVTNQIGDSEFDTSTEAFTIDADLPISKIQEWSKKVTKGAYCWGHIEIQFLND